LTGLGKALGGFFESPTLADEFEQVTLMHEPVEKWCDDENIAE
jgi:hypothetical protein